jgi:hypothetical protein
MVVPPTTRLQSLCTVTKDAIARTPTALMRLSSVDKLECPEG